MTEPLDNNKKDVLEKAVKQFIDAQLVGHEPDLDEFVKKFPDLEKDIRRRIQNLQEIDYMFSSLMEVKDDDLDEVMTGHKLIGQRLGDFEILNLIGTGGMGAVFLAHQISLDREVALKIISDVRGTQGKSLERFKRETQVLAKISHPNIVPIFEVGEQEPYSYYAMEYVKGISLDKILANIRNSSPEKKASNVMQMCLEAEANYFDEKVHFAGDSKGAEIDTEYIVTVSKIIINIASALEYAHNKGILHRDIKPSNILIDSNGTAKLVDFGLAKAETQQSVTLTGEFFGTPNYVSPEQIRKPETVDCRSDVFSLAVTYYECLTLHTPFEGNTINDTLTQVISRDVIPPKKYCPRLSSDFNTVLLKALEKVPDDRYKTVSDFATDIKNILDFKPITAKRPSITQRAYKTMRRAPLKTGVIIGILLICCIFSALIISNEMTNKKREDARRIFEVARNKMTSRNYTEALPYLDKALSKDPDFIEAYTASAECYRFLGNHDKSIELCKKVLSVHHDSLTAQLQLGLTLISLDNWEQARLAFQQAIDINPNFGRAHSALGVCYQNLKMNDEALEEYRKAIVVDPNIQDKKLIYLAMANILSTQEKNQEAIDTYQKALEIDPEDINAYSGIGNCYVSMGNLLNAENSFKKAVALAPNDSTVHSSLADFYISFGRKSDALDVYYDFARSCLKKEQISEALEYCNRIITIDPNHSLALATYGDCYYKMNNFEDAITFYNKALNVVVNDNLVSAIPSKNTWPAMVNCRLGECYQKINLNKEAEKAYLRAIELQDDLYVAYVDLALLYWGTEGRYEVAIQLYEKALEIEPKDLTIYLGMGMSYFAIGNYTKAVESYKKYLEVAPYDTTAYFFKGKSHQFLYQHNDAITALYKFIEINPTNVKTEVYGALALSLGMIQDYEGARSNYQKVIDSEPNNSQAWAGLGSSSQMLKDYEGAINAYKRALALNPESSYLSSAYSDLALIYSTCPDAKFRDGKEAVKLAQKACELSGYDNMFQVASLSAAYAECEDFDKAVEWQQKAIELAGENLRKEYEKRLDSYRAKKPWRQD